MKSFFQKLLALIKVRATEAGLEVSDEVLRLVYFDGKAWQMHALRLEPGILEKGKIKKRNEFLVAVKALKATTGRKNVQKKMNVVVCLSSVAAYTQIFNLPLVQGGDLTSAVELNLRMASPLAAGEAYSGWQIVGKDENAVKLEILSAFIERALVDEMVEVIFEAGFLARAVESKALALTRVLKEKGAGIDATKSYVFVNIDNSGMDFLIIRHGALYFEYTTAWRDIMDEKGEIPIQKFKESLGTSVRQVINFYNQHWQEPAAAIILSTAAFEGEAEKVIAENSSIPAARLTLVMGQPISSEWLVGLGCSLRGAEIAAQSREINLLGEDSQDRFWEEQLLSFMRFWRVVVPVTLGILILTFVGADIFLSNTRSQIESRSDLSAGGSEKAEVAILDASATAFNQSVALVAATEAMQSPKGVVLSDLLGLATPLGVTIDNLSFQSFGAPINLSGTAQSEDRVAAFKTAMENDPKFSMISLPLNDIETNGNTVSFSMTFVFTP